MNSCQIVVSGEFHCLK